MTVTNCPNCRSTNITLDGYLVCADCGKSFAVRSEYFGQCSCGAQVRYVANGSTGFSYEFHKLGRSETWSRVS